MDQAVYCAGVRRHGSGLDFEQKEAKETKKTMGKPDRRRYGRSIPVSLHNNSSRTRFVPVALRFVCWRFPRVSFPLAETSANQCSLHPVPVAAAIRVGLFSFDHASAVRWKPLIFTDPRKRPKG